MKLAVFDDYQIGVVDGDAVRAVSAAVPGWTSGDRYAMNRLIAGWASLRSAVEAAAANAPATPLAGVTLRAPVPAPMHLFAAPANYQAHANEMKTQGFSSAQVAPDTAETLGFFMKATGSISDPGAPIMLPLHEHTGRRFDYEGEIAFVVGREAKGVSPEEALDYIFGYTIVVDVTLRTTPEQREERVQRKSFASFSPMGPFVVTADAVDWKTINVVLRQNGEQKQDARSADMVVNIPRLLSRASHVLPLQPGDVYTTGSPPGVGQIVVGDTLEVESPAVGSMTLHVVPRDW